MGTRLTRKTFLSVVGAGAIGFALPGISGCGSERTQDTGESESGAPGKPQAQVFRSRPDLRPPTIEVTARAKNVAPGYVFVVPDKGPGQYGPLIFDNLGQPVWFHHSQRPLVRDFRTQNYRGEPVLTWWEGEVVGTRGVGEYVILDSSYREIMRLKAGNGYQGDLHEFKITPQDTVLITAYEPVDTEPSTPGRPEKGSVLEGIAQEIDLETGEVIFEWHSLEHVDVEESYLGPPGDPEINFDYFHINSVDIDYDDNFLVSARNTWTVYKIDRGSGEVMWRLGGKRNDFQSGPGVDTAFQHDARRQDDGTLTIFDNGASPEVHDQSRGIVLELDESAMTAELVRQYTHPEEKLLAGFLGNLQVLPNGNVFVGWGSEPFFSEFSRAGELLFDARFPPDYTSYRSYRLEWNGQPEDKPDITVEPGPGDEIKVHASWNGATEVGSWEVLAGSGPDNLRPGGSAPRMGFETKIVALTREPYVAVRARDGAGRIIGISETVEVGRTER